MYEFYEKFYEDDYEFKLEARYWNPRSQNICIVAIITKGIDWVAYIGAAPNASCERDALDYVSNWGTELVEKDALYFFPDIKLPYRN